MGVTEWCWTDYPEPQSQRSGWLEAAVGLPAPTILTAPTAFAMDGQHDIGDTAFDAGTTFGTAGRILPFPPAQRHELHGMGGEVPVEDLSWRQRHGQPFGILPRPIDASPEFQFAPHGLEDRIGILQQPPELSTHRLN